MTAEHVTLAFLGAWVFLFLLGDFGMRTVVATAMLLCAFGIVFTIAVLS